MNSSNIEQKNFSKECIQTALLSLMETKLLRDISISEIAEKAGVSRNAFYRNYNSKEQIIEQYIQDVTVGFYQNKDDENSISRKNYLINLFTHLYNQRKLIEKVRKNNLSYMLESVFIDYTKKVTKKFSNNKYTDYYIGGGFYALTMQWANSGYKETPEEIADILTNIQSNISEIEYISE